MDKLLAWFRKAKKAAKYALRGLTLIRGVGLLMITNAGLLMAMTFGLIEGAIEVMQAVNELFVAAATGTMQKNFQAEFGKTCILFFGLMAMTAFTVIVWRGSKASLLAKLFFAVPMGGAIALGFMAFVLDNATVNQGNWYEYFWRDTLGPVALIAGLVWFMKNFWRITEPTTAAPPAAPEGERMLLDVISAPDPTADETEKSGEPSAPTMADIRAMPGVYKRRAW